MISMISRNIGNIFTVSISLSFLATILSIDRFSKPSSLYGRRIYFYYLINKNPKYFLSSLQTTSIIFRTRIHTGIFAFHPSHARFTLYLSYTERERENIAMKMADRFNIRPGLPCGNLKCRWTGRLKDPVQASQAGISTLNESSLEKLSTEPLYIRMDEAS